MFGHRTKYKKNVKTFERKKNDSETDASSSKIHVKYPPLLLTFIIMKEVFLCRLRYGSQAIGHFNLKVQKFILHLGFLQSQR